MKVDIPVTTTVLPMPMDAAAQLPLQSFRDLASTAQALQVSHDGSGWKVVAAQAAGVEQTGSDADSTAVFIEVLGQAFSRGIQQAVVRELELQPRPGQPLEARLVLRAIAMAEASEQALQGVDFMTQLQFSAAAQSAEFVAICRAAGVAPQSVGAHQRAAIDACMQQRFADAARQKQIPVAPETAREWLQAELAAQTPKTH